MRYSVILTVILALLKFPSLAQQPENKYDHFLDSLSVSVPALNQQVDISVSDISIKELVRISVIPLKSFHTGTWHYQ